MNIVYLKVYFKDYLEIVLEGFSEIIIPYRAISDCRFLPEQSPTEGGPIASECLNIMHRRKFFYLYLILSSFKLYGSINMIEPAS